MANDVFANNREISCKKADGKSICAFPDVCMTPPENPATPPGVPVPYPNTGMARDTTNGSRSVKISGQEILLKNKSYFKKSTGDEAGCAAKKGVVTSVHRGKVYFNAWSMDVKAEGENVVRHLDITTHNHASFPANTPTWPYLDSQAVGTDHPCHEDKAKEREACEKLEVRSEREVTYEFNERTLVLEPRVTGGELDAAATKAAQCADTPEAKECQKARKCMLTPYDAKQCCPGETGDHIIETHSFMYVRKKNKNMPEFPKYNQYAAPVVCAKCPRGSRFYEEHGDLHAVRGAIELGAMSRAGDAMAGRAWTYADARRAAIISVQATFPDSGCSEACLQEQLDNYHKNTVEVDDSTPVRSGPGSLGNKGTDRSTDSSQWRRGLELIDQYCRRMAGATGA